MKVGGRGAGYREGACYSHLLTLTLTVTLTKVRGDG